jgi:hypothetical protein
MSAQARSSTQAPSSEIRPEASASGMNSDGGTGVPSSVQRTSASTAIVSPLGMSTIGW